MTPSLAETRIDTRRNRLRDLSPAASCRPRWNAEPDASPDALLAEDDGLLADLYDDLQGLAGAYLHRQGHAFWMDPSALIHEAWIKIARATRSWDGRSHVLAVFAKAMRQILVDHQRAYATAKRGGGWTRVTLHADVLPERRKVDPLIVDEALAVLERRSERMKRIVELRFMEGLTVDESAAILGVSRRTLLDDWRQARVILADVLDAAA